MTEHDTSYLDDIRAESAYELAREAGCMSPDNRSSAGALVLNEVRDDIVDAWVEGRFAYDSTRDDYDTAQEIAGSCLPDDNTFWDVFADLGFFREESDFISEGVWSGTFDDIGRQAGGQVVDRLAAYVITAIRKAFNGWICPLCGDTGEPRICFPGDCRSSDEDQAEWQAAQAAELASQGIGHGLGIHPREIGYEAASVASEAASDPILTLIAEVEAEGPSVTQQFMTRMSAANVAEFADRARRAKRRKVALSVLAIVTGLGILVAALMGAL